MVDENGIQWDQTQQDASGIQWDDEPKQATDAGIQWDQPAPDSSGIQWDTPESLAQDEADWRQRTGNMDPSVPVPQTLAGPQLESGSRGGIGHWIDNASIAAGKTATAGLQDTVADVNMVGAGAARLAGADQQTQDSFLQRVQENSEAAARNRMGAYDINMVGAAGGELLGLAPLLVGGQAALPERVAQTGRRTKDAYEAGKHALPVAAAIGQQQASSQAADAVNRGADTETAMKVYGTGLAANTLANVVPASVGGRVVTRAATGAALGAGAAAGTQEALHQVAPEQFEGSTKETLLTGGGIGALFGTTMGRRGAHEAPAATGDKPGVRAKVDPKGSLDARRKSVADILRAGGEGVPEGNYAERWRQANKELTDTVRNTPNFDLADSSKLLQNIADKYGIRVDDVGDVKLDGVPTLDETNVTPSEADVRAANAPESDQLLPASSGNPITDRLAKRLNTDHAGAVAEYDHLPGTNGGRILDNDLARELSPDYRADRTKSADVHEPSSAFIKKLYAEKLAKPTPKGDDPVVLFTAGGTGAGKTSGLKAIGDSIGKPEIVYDTNMNGFDSSLGKVRAALKAGREVKIAYTYREPVDALGGALKRAQRMERESGTGRTGPIDKHAETHIGSADAIRRLFKKYQKNPKVHFYAIDNSHGVDGARPMDIEKIPNLGENTLHERLNDATFEGFAGRSRKAGRGTPDDRSDVRPDQQVSTEAGSDRSVTDGAETATPQDAPAGAEGKPQPENTDQTVPASADAVARVAGNQPEGDSHGRPEATPEQPGTAARAAEGQGGGTVRDVPRTDEGKAGGATEPESGQGGGAERSGEKTIPGQVYDEANGFTQSHAAMLDSELNIRDGQGKVSDYVQFFKHNPAFHGAEGRQNAESRGLLARATGRRAYTLASKGGDELLAAHRAGEITDQAAVQIAEAAPGDGRLQTVGMKAVQDGKSITNAVNTMRAVETMARDRASGQDQGSSDMFAFDDSAMREAEAMAKIASRKQREINERLAAVTGASKRPELAKREGVDVKNQAALEKRIQDLRVEKDSWDRWNTDPAKVEQIRRELNAGKPQMSLSNEADSGAPLSRSEVNKVAVDIAGVDAVNRRFVITDWDGLPSKIRADAAEQGIKPGGIEGVYWHGKTYLVDGAIRSPAKVRELVFHEHYTHHGLRAKYGDQMGARLGGLLYKVGGIDGVRKLAAKQDIDLSEYEKGVLGNKTIPERQQRVILMEDLMAHMSKTTGTLRRTIEEYTGLVRDFVRRNGFVELSKYGVTDLAAELRGARQAAQSFDAQGSKGGPMFMRRKGGARQGKTGGVTDAGDGGLFDGKRPEQADLAEPSNGADDARFSRVRSDLTEGQEAALDKVGVSPKVVPLKAKLHEYAQHVRKEAVQGIFDQFEPLKRLDIAAYMQARMSRGTDGALEAMFLHGPPKLTDGALDVTADGKGFKGVLSDLKGEHDLFLAWTAGNRAEALSKEWTVSVDGKSVGRYKDRVEANRAAIKMRSEKPEQMFGGGKSPDITAEPAGRERWFTDHQIAELKKLNQGKMEDGRDRRDVYGKANLEFRKYQNAVLKIAEESGLIDGAQREAWRDQFYVPFYRLLDASDSKHPATHGNAALVRQKAFETLKGSDKPLNDLFENTLSNWSHLLTSSMRNMAGDKSLAAAEGMGIAHQLTSPEKGSVWIMRNGQQVHYRVDDDMVLDALLSLNYTGIQGRGMDTMRVFKRALTTGVTLSPTFRVRNLARDTLSALAVSDDAGYNPIKNIAQGWKGTNRGSETSISLLAGGGKIHFGAMLDGQQAANAKRLVREGVSGVQILDNPEKIKKAFKGAWVWWKDVGDKSETINRAVLYENAIKAGKNHLEASYEARDLLDFTMGGKWTTVRLLTGTVPFMNARLQGLYKLGKAGKNNPARFAAVTGTVALASALNYLLQKDDPDYKALPDWARDTYWPVKLGDKMYFIPKPFEVGAMGSVVERTTELAVGGDDYRAKDFAYSLANIIGDQLSMNPTPQAFKPVIESLINYDMFQQRPIDTMSDERLSPEYRARPTTSAGAIAVGKAINISPKRVEHMVRGYFGWLGQQALNVSDLLSRSAMGLPSNPKRDITKVDNMFGVGDFVKDTEGGYSKYVDRLYQIQDRVNRAYADLNHARKTGDVEDVKDLSQSEDLRLRPVANAGAKQISAIRSRIKQVGNSRTLSAHEKRLKIDEYRERQNDIARRTDQRVREIEGGD